MKKFIIGAAFAAVSSTCAFAADLPVQAYKSTPVVAQVYNWTGLYVGVNGGYGWGSQDPLTLVSNRFDRTSFDISGGMFGGTMGAQIQQGYVVLGLEGDLDWANIKGNGISNPAIAGIGQGITLNIDVQDQRRWNGKSTRWRRYEQLAALRDRRCGICEIERQWHLNCRRALRYAWCAPELRGLRLAPWHRCRLGHGIWLHT